MVSFVEGLVGDAEHYVGDAYDWTTGELTKVYTWTDTEVGKLAGWTTAEVKKVGNDVFSFVTRGIQAVEHIYDDAIDSIHHAIHDIRHDLDDIGGWAASAAKWIASAPDLIAHYVDTGVAAVVHDVIDPLAHAVATVTDEVAHTAAGAVTSLTDELHHLEVDTVGPLTKWVGESGHWFSTEFSTAWGKVYGDVVGPALSDLTTAVGDVEGAAEWVATEGVQAVQLVVECAEWLEWMAAHSFSDIEAAVSAVTGGLTPSAIGAVTTALPTVTDPIASFATALFASGTP